MMRLLCQSYKLYSNKFQFVGLLSFSSIDISTNNYTSNSSSMQGSRLRLALFLFITKRESYIRLTASDIMLRIVILLRSDIVLRTVYRANIISRKPQGFHITFAVRQKYHSKFKFAISLYLPRDNFVSFDVLSFVYTKTGAEV